MPFDPIGFNDRPEPDGLRRLRRLEKVIEGVPDEAYDIRVLMNSCGTVGCTAGWGANDATLMADCGLPLGAHGALLMLSRVLFEITVAEEARLFVPSGGVTSRRELLAHLRTIIAEKAAAHANAEVTS